MKRYALFLGCLIPVKYPQFEAAVRKTSERLGLELVDIPEFGCCPDPIFFKASSYETWLAAAARNLALAEAKGLDVTTICSGCTATLAEVSYHLRHDEALRERVNQRLEKIGHRYEGRTRVRHLIALLRDEVGVEGVRATVVRPLEGLKVAVHYGCHLLKPGEIMEVDDPNHPTVLERMVEAIGATPLRHDLRLLCCGKACLDPEAPNRMTADVLDSVKRTEADCMAMVCPTCFDRYDVGQILLARKMGREFKVPVVYYWQLLGLAQGFSPQEMGLHLHKIPVPEILHTVQ
jgi:heterodisulfide reductase subunit B